jgi:hypothetical protein
MILGWTCLGLMSDDYDVRPVDVAEQQASELPPDRAVHVLRIKCRTDRCYAWCRAHASLYYADRTVQRVAIELAPEITVPGGLAMMEAVR